MLPGSTGADGGKLAFIQCEDAPLKKLAQSGWRGSIVQMRVAMQRKLVAAREPLPQKAVITERIGNRESMVRRHYQQGKRDIGNRGNRLQQALAQCPGMRCHVMHRHTQGADRDRAVCGR